LHSCILSGYELNQGTLEQSRDCLEKHILHKVTNINASYSFCLLQRYYGQTLLSLVPLWAKE